MMDCTNLRRAVVFVEDMNEVSNSKHAYITYNTNY